MSRTLTVTYLMILVGLAATSLLTSCSSGNVTDGVDVEGAQETGGVAEDRQVGPSSSSQPLGDPDNAGPGNPEGFLTLYDLLLAQEIVIQECMEAEGFDFVPKTIDPKLAENTLDAHSEFELTDFDFALEQAAETGYGELYSLLAYEPQVSAENVEDPNDEILANLSEAERSVYVETLYGTDTEQGCLDKGAAFARGQSIPTEKELAVIREREREIEESILADERMVDATKDWFFCMSEAGFDFESLSGPAELMDERIHSVLGFELTSDLSQDELEELLGKPQTREELARLLEFERELATTDVECARRMMEIGNELYREYSERS